MNWADDYYSDDSEDYIYNSDDSIEDYIYSSNYNDSVDYIYNYDREFAESDKEHGKYYIGSCEIVPDIYGNRELLQGPVVSKKAFFRTPFIDIKKYLTIYRIMYSNFELTDVVNIVKLCVVNDKSTVIIKTFWIRIIQQNWKRVFKERQDKIKKQKSISSLRHRELTGKFPIGLNILPSLNGMLFGV